MTKEAMQAMVGQCSEDVGRPEGIEARHSSQETGSVQPRPLSPQELVMFTIDAMNAGGYTLAQAESVLYGLAAELMVKSLKIHELNGRVEAGQGRMILVDIRAEVVQRISIDTLHLQPSPEVDEPKVAAPVEAAK